MSYSIGLPLSGLAGWSFLKRTSVQQSKMLQASPELVREVKYFKDNIIQIDSTEKLLADRRLLKVALTAFGLEGDLTATAFVRKVLTDGTTRSDALANRLADKRYLAFAKAFDFSQPTPKSPAFAEALIKDYYARRFETAVGAVAPAYRLALNAENALKTLAQSQSSDTVKWLRILGDPQLRTVFETAFALPKTFGQLDMDQQLRILSSRSQSQLGIQTVSDFADPAQIEKLNRLYVMRDDMSGLLSTTPAQNALNILSQARR